MDRVIQFFDQFFSVIGDSFSAIIEAVVDFFNDLVFVVATLGKFVIEIPGYFMWLPSEIIALLVTIFAIVVIYMILGRK